MATSTPTRHGDDLSSTKYNCWVYAAINEPGAYFKAANKQAKEERPRTIVLAPEDLPKAKTKKPRSRAPAIQPKTKISIPKTAPKPNVVLPPKPTAITTPKAKTKFIKKINNLGREKTGIEKPKPQSTPYTKPDVSLIYRTTGYISTPWGQRERN